MTHRGFYAVKVGRYGNDIIYDTWDDAIEATFRYSGATWKKFRTYQAAWRWLTAHAARRAPFSLGSSRRSSRKRHSSSRVATTLPVGFWAQGLSGPSAPSPITSPSADVSETYPYSSGSVTCQPCPSSPSSDYYFDQLPDISMFCSELEEEIIKLESTGHKAELPTPPLNACDPMAPATLRSESPDVDWEPDDTVEEVIDLSDEQQAILEEVVKGRSVFFTGSAGTGKSVLLRAIIRKLHSKKRKVAITAPTGIASVNVGGCTIHSFAGIGLGKEDVPVLLKKIQPNEAAVKRWRKTQTLIIDEISMLDGRLFDKLEEIAHYFRGERIAVGEETRPNGRPKTIWEYTPTSWPFGGLQLVICGDFFQLPPVPDKLGFISIPATYAFDAKTWGKCVPNCYMLTQVFRQRDSTFVDMLNQMRIGIVEPATVEQFTQLERPLYYDDGLEPMQLFPRNKDVLNANSKRLAELPGPSHSYRSIDKPGYKKYPDFWSEDETARLLERCPAPEDLSLRIGAQVMMVQNMIFEDDKLVNGSLGRVIGFITQDDAEKQGRRIAMREDTGWFRGLPSPYARPPTDEQPSSDIQSSQATLVDYPCSQCPHKEQGCLCQSTRTRHLADSKTAVWPIVKFLREGEWVVVPAIFTVTNVFGHVDAYRLQVPLVLAWALSIHKSQGQTLERVKIDLGGTFETGQAYVALSRARSLQTLQVLNFNAALVRADSRVIDWYKPLKVHGSSAKEVDYDSDTSSAYYWKE